MTSDSAAARVPPTRPSIQQADQLAEELQNRQKAARQRIVSLLRSYPRDTPPEHIIFGYGGVRISFGEMLDAFGVANP